MPVHIEVGFKINLGNIYILFWLFADKANKVMFTFEMILSVWLFGVVSNIVYSFPKNISLTFIKKSYI